MGHSQGDSLTNLMLITTFVQVQPEGHQEPRNKVGALSLAEYLAGFELGTFWYCQTCMQQAAVIINYWLKMFTLRNTAEKHLILCRTLGI